MAFASAIQDNTLQLHDLVKSSSLDLKASERTTKGGGSGTGGLPLTSVSFNCRERSLLATGDGYGRVHVWKLTEEFTSGNATAEMAKMEALTINNED